jgi:hypothetical protein
LHWLFLSQHGLGALMNQRVTFRSCFVDFFWVKRGCERFWIHASLLEGVSVTISESAATQFSLTISDSVWAVGVDESTRHLWMVFRWWFLSPLWNQFRWWFQRRQWLNLHWLFLSQQGLGALMNPRVTFGSCFVHDFRVRTDSVFVDFFFVNRACERFRIHASPLEGVSVMLSESAPT